MIDQSTLKNEAVRSHVFLEGMYRDLYFPNFLVDKCKFILLELCAEIETTQPETLEELYTLTDLTASRLNKLDEEFFERNSGLETAAAENFVMDLMFISDAYGFEKVDMLRLHRF